MQTSSAQNVRIVAFDLDGTFLTSQKAVSARNRAAVEALREHGIEPVPTTGRAPVGLLDRMLGGLEGVRYMVAVNGAIVLDLAEGEEIVHKHIEGLVAGKLVRRVLQPGIVCYLHLDDAANTRMGSYLSEEEFRRVCEDAKWHENLCVDAAERVEPVGALKVGVHFIAPWTRADFMNLASELGISAADSDKNNIEFGPAHTSKLTGLQALCARLGVGLDEVCAIGDAGNDVAMIDAAGLGVAMGNASDEVLAVASEVTRTNDEDGFADFVERLLAARG